MGVLGKIATLEVMNSFLECVLPWLAAIDDITKQEGAIEALACILSSVSTAYFKKRNQGCDRHGTATPHPTD